MLRSENAGGQLGVFVFTSSNIVVPPRLARDTPVVVGLRHLADTAGINVTVRVTTILLCHY